MLVLGPFGPLALWTLLTCWTYSLVDGVRMRDLAILDHLLRNHYDRRATPTNHLNSKMPTYVLCEIFVRSLTSIDPLTMDYKADLYLRQKWTDDRLKHENLTQPLDLNDPNLVKAIWKPEVYFPNAKEADFQFVTVPNVLVRINPDGEILYMLRLKCTFSCEMDLLNFPHDRQKCTMEIASFSKTVEELILQWKEHEPVTTARLGMSQFELEKIHTDKCASETITNSYKDIRRNYSCLVAEFHLTRSIGFHLVQSYLPTILMVVISWVSFWMDVNSVPGRVTLGVTTLLTVSSKATNIQENLPQTSYVKAIDIWMGACTGFVFLALMEFIVVNYLWRKECCRSIRFIPHIPGNCTPDTQSKITGAKEVEGYDRSPMACSTIIEELSGANSFIQNHNHHNQRLDCQPNYNYKDHKGSQQCCTSDEEDEEPTPHSHLRKLAHWQTRARSIDEICRFAFPATFFLFICIYCYYYY